MIDNQVLSDKVEDRVEELAKLDKVMNTDVVVLTHVKIKLKQMEETNAMLAIEAEEGSKTVAEVCIFDLKPYTSSFSKKNIRSTLTTN